MNQRICKLEAEAPRVIKKLLQPTNYAFSSIKDHAYFVILEKFT